VRGAPVQTVELFVNVLHHLIAQERGQIAPERGQFLFVGSLYYFLEKNRMCFRWPCQLNGRGYEKLAFFDHYIALFQKW